MGASGSSYVGTTTDGDDRLVGGAGSDTLNGGDGSDYLNGGSGSDTLDGGSGFDTVLGGSGADTLIFVSYENQYRLDGIYSGGTLSGGTIYDDGQATSLTSFSGYDSYDGGNGSVKAGTAEIDTLRIVVSVQQSNDTAFMQALNAEIAYFTNVWLPAHVNKNTGQADQAIYEFRTINLKISAIEKIAPVTVDLSTNRAPTNTLPQDGVLASEDVAKAIVGVSVADPDGGLLTTVVSVQHGTLAVTPGSTSVSGNGTSSVTISGTAAQINSVLATLNYTGSANYSGSDALGITTTDAIGASDTDNLAIAVTPVADAPMLTSPDAAGDEDSAIALSFSAALTDTDGSESLSITIAGVPAGASLSAGTDNGGGTWTLTQAQLAGLTITPPADSDADFTLTVTATATEAANGDTATTTDTVTVTVNAVNDAPSGASNTVATDEDTPYVFGASDFGFSDPVEGHALAAVRIGSLPAAGTLLYAGIAITAAQVAAGYEVSASDLALGKLSFAPAANANGNGYASFAFQVRDNGGTANGGIDLDQSPNTITIDVNPVNDAPVNTVPGAQTANSNTAKPITGVQVSDIDSPNLTTTLTVSNGTLTVATGGGGSFSGNGTASVTISGTQAQINAALAALAYTSNLNYSGSDTLTVFTSDGGLSDSDMVAITVNAPLDNQGPTNVKFSPDLAGLGTLESGGNLNAGALMGSFVPTGDPNSSVFTFALGGANAASFSLNVTTGVLSVGGANVGAGTYQITVTATDQAGNSSAAIPFTVWIGGTGGQTFAFAGANDFIGYGLNGNDSVTGSSGDDFISGGQNVDTVSGGAGNDILVGGDNNDTLTGGSGNDTLIGGSGNDKFFFGTPGAANGIDKVVDILGGGDQIGLLQGGGGWNAPGSSASASGTALAAGDYVNQNAIANIVAGNTNKVVEIQTAQSASQIATTAAGAANAYVLVFNSTTGFGELWHDANWSDAAGRAQVATFEDVDTLTELLGLSAANIVEWV